MHTTYHSHFNETKSIIAMATSDVICRLHQNTSKILLPYGKQHADFNGFIGFSIKGSIKEL